MYVRNIIVTEYMFYLKNTEIVSSSRLLRGREVFCFRTQHPKPVPDAQTNSSVPDAESETLVPTAATTNSPVTNAKSETPVPAAAELEAGFQRLADRHLARELATEEGYPGAPSPFTCVLFL
ncbi:hypothetical protein PHYSODRAFT_294505 [Phytophthora sojae]|uniref:Uncharacterized protein n=1 Tax=Phytophthora sojae (strain P6497) TaxID=1094619 RepID=G4YMT3_PHYSP|nr:hypothetical protein PHYSODRAFT_294505 [Phytophthora sojae]EGZ29279.1 hypothetical protein PHYSODRAFT_294505 [Phytophthora sojae]|eukprot:XP_009516554.1 hypothetical protein PHYSODRAFT_294505 [Phytophthora sojae]